MHKRTSLPICYKLNHEQSFQLDDASLQVYKDGDYGSYLDLESSLAEQIEEIEGLNESRKNSLVVRTQLSVRVHVIIGKFLNHLRNNLINRGHIEYMTN